MSEEQITALLESPSNAGWAWSCVLIGVVLLLLLLAAAAMLWLDLYVAGQFL